MRRLEAVLSEASLEALELPVLLKLLAELAATDLGQSRLLRLRPLCCEEELARQRSRYQEASLLLADKRLVPAFASPLQPLLERLKSGDCELSGPDILSLAEMLETTAGVAEEIGAHAGEYPALAQHLAALPASLALVRRIRQTLDRRGQVREDASPELAAVRKRVRGARERLYQQLTDFVRQHQQELAEETIPLRDGRLMVLLPAGSRGRLRGLFHGRSATGHSFYFEPLETVDSNNQLHQALEEEEAERIRIFQELVSELRQARPMLEAHAAFLADLDVLQASYRFAQISDARLAEWVPRYELRLAAARHPLLDPRLAELREAALGQPGHTESVVPLDLELTPGERVLVVTGPNAGGKTVALKTLGLLALASQCGLPIPAARGTCLPLFQRVVAMVGDEQNLLIDQSTFSARLLRLKEAWHEAGPDSLILLDELGSGTSPEEGRALAQALLEGLLERGTVALLTTHLTDLALAAMETPGASCAAMEFDPGTGQPTFHLLPGPPGSSEALALAHRLELPQELLTRAEQHLGRGYRDLKSLLAEVERLRRRLTEELSRARKEAEAAAVLRGQLEQEEAALEAERKGLATRFREDLNKLRRATRERFEGEVERLRRELEAGRRRGLAREATARLVAEVPQWSTQDSDRSLPLDEGQSVRHRELGWQGSLEKLDGERAEVWVHGKRIRCSRDELVAVTEKQPEGLPQGRSQQPVKWVQEAERPEAPAELNLIGQRVEPALDSLEAFIDQALLASHERVRVIHGHGSGRLREAVRQRLRSHPAVERVRPGGKHEGGDGATVVTLKGG